MKTFIKCEKCGSLNVDEIVLPNPPPEPQKPTILSMDGYISQNKSKSTSFYQGSTSGDICIETERHQKMKLHCFECGFEKEWTKTVYW